MNIIEKGMKCINLNKIEQFKYNKVVINYADIDDFTPININNDRKNNDKKNKIRENIIGSIINNKVPLEYFKEDNNMWNHIKKELTRYFKEIDNSYIKIECDNMGGRKNNYDFKIKLHNTLNISELNVEFKFNASSIDAIPQFVSPTKPSEYMAKSYEDYYYEKFLPELSILSGYQIPSKETYNKDIHSNKPKCMKKYQDLYYQGCKGSSQFTNKEDAIKFYDFSKKISEQSISTFIGETDLDISKLSSYLLDTQKNKIYMFYYKNTFISQNVNMDDYKLESVKKNPLLSRYECISKSGKKINVLLRWKNGNGIAWPAFQISCKN